jgi:hypothetical protein
MSIVDRKWRRVSDPIMPHNQLLELREEKREYLGTFHYKRNGMYLFRIVAGRQVVIDSAYEWRIRAGDGEAADQKDFTTYEWKPTRDPGLPEGKILLRRNHMIYCGKLHSITGSGSRNFQIDGYATSIPRVADWWCEIPHTLKPYPEGFGPRGYDID